MVAGSCCALLCPGSCSAFQIWNSRSRTVRLAAASAECQERTACLLVLHSPTMGTLLRSVSGTSGSVTSIPRAIHVIDLLAHRAPLGVRAIAQQLGLPLGSAHRILLDL